LSPSCIAIARGTPARSRLRAEHSFQALLNRHLGRIPEAA